MPGGRGTGGGRRSLALVVHVLVTRVLAASAVCAAWLTDPADPNPAHTSEPPPISLGPLPAGNASRWCAP